MKQKKLTIFLVFMFFAMQASKRTTILITSSLKKSTHHRFIVPALAASELTVTALYMLIPILLASLGNINVCLPASPEIILENHDNILHLK